MTPQDQQRLFLQIQAGDRQALKVLFEQEYPSVCATIKRLVRDSNLAEDLAQEVFVRFWVKREELHITSSVSAYLRKMAANEALAHLRRKRTFAMEEWTPVPESDIGDNAEERYLEGELQVHIQEAIDELPPRCRTIFQLSRHEELTYREIAERLDISIKTVENQMGKALKYLRNRLRGYLHLFF